MSELFHTPPSRTYASTTRYYTTPEVTCGERCRFWSFRLFVALSSLTFILFCFGMGVYAIVQLVESKYKVSVVSITGTVLMLLFCVTGCVMWTMYVCGYRRFCFKRPEYVTIDYSEQSC